MTGALLALVLLVATSSCDRIRGGPIADAAPNSEAAGRAGLHEPIERIPAGAIVADSGFRPDDHGFAFENYGRLLPDGEPAVNLTPEDVRTMFGSNVCADPSAVTCALIPEAELWLEKTNADMSLGHCYGLAVASSLLWERTITPSQFGGLEPPALAIDENESLQRRIAYDWAAQLLDSVRSKVLQGTPNQLLTSLRKHLRPNPTEHYTIVLWKDDGTGGHAVTPFAVEEDGDGLFSVLIYDNNWPGETRAIVFDTRSDTWVYDAAVNPDEDSELYRGTSKSSNLALFPLSPGLGVQRCPFCGTRNRSGEAPPEAVGPRAAATLTPTMEIFLQASPTDHGHLLITHESGLRIGYVGGRLVEEIPGGRVVRVSAGRPDLEPHYVVPAVGHYTITLDASRLDQDDIETVGVIGPSYNVSIRDVLVRAGDREALVVGLDGEAITYSAPSSRTPTIRAGVSDAMAAYDFELRGLSEQPGTQVELRLPIDSGMLSLREHGATGTSRLSVQIRRFSAAGVDVFRNHGIELASDEAALFQYGDWGGELADLMPLTVHRRNSSTTSMLENNAIPSGP